MIEKKLQQTAELACARARKQGAKEAAASVAERRSYKVVVRDGKVEELKASVSRRLAMRVYVDGRYGRHTTSDLEPTALGRFIDDAVEMTRFLMPDKHRSLPDPKLYQGRSKAALGIHDPQHDKLTTTERRRAALALHDAARAKAGAHVISVGAAFYDSARQWVLVQSNGFTDGDRSTSYGQWADVSVKDPAGRRPSDWAESMARRRGDLASPELTGGEAAQRAVAAIGAGKIETVKLPLVIENRAVSRILRGLLSPLSGWALDQKRSCFDGKQGQAVASKLLTITDDPLRAGGWGSRRFDGEGISARSMPVLDHGVLRNYYIDSYYGKKLKQPPTTGGRSNLVFAAGERDLETICKRVGKAVLVTRFIGGNSNSTTGDFSHGLGGFLLEGGKRSRPLASMNVAGNHLEFWKGLVELGNDPYLHSTVMTPSLLFEPVLVSGK